MPSVCIKDTFKLRTGVCILASRPIEATLILDKIKSAFPQLQFLESKISSEQQYYHSTNNQ